MTLPGRTTTGNDYRYGFNGKEKDDELKGIGNSYDFGARMLDPRVGRWFSIDPLAMNYPYDSPYLLSGNSPISLDDPDGERKRKVTKIFNQQGELIGEKISTVDYSFIEKKVYSVCRYSGDGQVSFDYYDSVDLEIQVVDSKGMLLNSNIVERDILADKRIDGSHGSVADTRATALALTDEYGVDLMGKGDTWGGGGVDFYSKNGEGSGIVAKDRSKVDYVNGDDMISFLSTGGAMGRPGKTNTSPFPDNFNDTKVKDLLAKVKVVVKTTKKAHGNADNMQKSIMVVRKICNNCERLLSKEEEDSHRTLGDGTRDTLIVKNPKHE